MASADLDRGDRRRKGPKAWRGPRVLASTRPPAGPGRCFGRRRGHGGNCRLGAITPPRSTRRRGPRRGWSPQYRYRRPSALINRRIWMVDVLQVMESLADGPRPPGSRKRGSAERGLRAHGRTVSTWRALRRRRAAAGPVPPRTIRPIPGPGAVSRSKNPAPDRSRDAPDTRTPSCARRPRPRRACPWRGRA